MSDRLDAVLETVAPLLRRVGDILSVAGAPADHEVWPALRRVRLLPWDAVRAVAALRPAELSEAGPELRLGARDYAGIAESLPPPGVWSGEAADAYDAVRRRTAGHLSGTDDSLDERLAATAALAEDLAAWMSRARSELALAVAGILSSAEALELSAGTGGGRIDPASSGEAEAAARIATIVLEAVAAAYDSAAELMTATEPLAEVSWS